MIPSLPEPTRTAVRVAFAQAMAVVWKVMLGIAGGGMLTVFLLKEIPMHTATDNTYGLEERAHELAQKRSQTASSDDLEGGGTKLLASSSSQAVAEEKAV